MDWTYSPYVALHFAYDALLQRMSEPPPKPTPGLTTSSPPKASVWAINIEWLKTALKASLSPEEFEIVNHKKNAVKTFDEFMTGKLI